MRTLAAADRAKRIELALRIVAVGDEVAQMALADRAIPAPADVADPPVPEPGVPEPPFREQ